MRAAYHQYLKEKGLPSCCSGRCTSAVEDARAREKEAAELRLARIQNGAEEYHKNGFPSEPKSGN